jgi:uncharacterized membrane protein
MNDAREAEGWLEHFLKDEWLLLTAAEHKLSEAEHRALASLLHRTKTVRNANEIAAETRSTSHRIADWASNWMGSWTFVALQVVIFGIWITLNEEHWTSTWDGYPFNTLNLVLALMAALALPILLMSQNRQQARDRIVAEQDYQSDLRQELEITALRALSEEILSIHREQRQILGRLDQLTGEVHTAVGEMHRAVHEVHRTVHSTKR